MEVKGNFLTFAGVTNVTDCRTAQEVLEKANLNFTVAKSQLYAKMPGQADYDNDYNNGGQFFHGSESYKEVINAFATYRTDNNTPLGVVTDRYTPIQNIDCFRIFDNAIGRNTAQWFTAGCYSQGNKVFVSAKLGSNVLVKGKDPIDLFLVFSTTHDGTQSLRIMITPIRLICFNKLSIARRQADTSITIRHTVSAKDKIDTAHEILQITKKRAVMFEEVMNKLANTPISDKEALKQFGYVLLSSQELKDLANADYEIEDLTKRNYNAIEASGISMTKVNQLNKMVQYYHLGAGQQEWLGTKYGVYNAINGFYSNCVNDNGIKRFDNLIYGKNSEKIVDAYNNILN